jgi:hypothetical protein
MSTVSGQRPYSPLKGIVYIILGRLLIFLSFLIWGALVMYQGHQEGGKLHTLYPGVIPSLILGAIGVAGVRCARRGKKLRTLPGELLLKQDTRAPVVYLRSFAVDGSEITMSDSPASSFSMFGLRLEVPTAEEDLARVFYGIGPFVAIGNPSEALPELGASRIYVGNSDWHMIVTDLVRRAKIVILRIGTSKGLLWEIENVVNNCSPEAVLLYLPSSPARQKRKATENRNPDLYDEFRQLANPRLPHPLPEAIGRSRFISFGKSWVPECAQPPSIPRRDLGMDVTGSQARNMRSELKSVFEQLGLNSESLPEPASVSGLLVLLAVLVGLALIFLGGLVLVDLVPEGMLTPRSHSYEHAQISTGTDQALTVTASAWQSWNVIDLQISVPGFDKPEQHQTRIKQPSPEQEQFIEASEGYQIESRLLLVLAQRCIYKPGIELSLDGAVQGGVDQMAARTGITGLQYSFSPASVSGESAVRTHVVFTMKGQHLRAESLTFISGRTMWQVVAMGRDSQQAQATSERILASVTRQ